MWILVLIGLGVITGLAQLALAGFPSETTINMHTLLLHQFAVTHGLLAVIGFFTNVITPRQTAEKLGWATSPYQIKYGFQQLGLGIIGALTIWFQGNFWAATLITLYIYGASGLWTHTQEVVRKHRENGTTDWIEIGNIVLDVIYHVVLTWMSLLIPGVWSLA